MSFAPSIFSVEVSITITVSVSVAVAIMLLFIISLSLTLFSRPTRSLVAAAGLTPWLRHSS
jgi:hypothetical protein